MIGRLPHPLALDASRIVYVTLIYRGSSGDWQPLPGGYYDTELEALTACVDELTRRAEEVNAAYDELRVNLGRLHSKVGVTDVVHIGGGAARAGHVHGLSQAYG